MSSPTPIVDRIGPYRVVRALGSSGAASFVAREEGPIGFTREVVLKLIANPTSEDGSIVKELAREATICSKLNHPNIIRTLDFFEHDKQLVLVLEHVDGVNLAELLWSLRENGRRLSDDAVFYIGVAILEALAHAHAHLDDEGERTPIVHRAVSPSTVSLGKDGSVKLGGFGLAKILSEEPDTIVGPRDASYMAPEQRISEKVDVYAAGLLLWELLTGRPPPEHIEPLSSVRRDLPRELLAAVDAALEANSQKRTISCADMASWIKKVTHTARGRKEVRERVIELATSFDSSHEPTPATAELSGAIPIAGWTAWTAKLPPVLSAGPRWLDRLPRRQRRAVWVGAAGVLVMIPLLAMGRAPSHPTAVASLVPAAPTVLEAALSATGPAAQAPTATAPTALAPTVAVPGLAADPTASPPPDVALPVPAGDYNRTKFGFLTVHSTVPYSFVYVHLLRYGKIEDRLIVPCGKRFVSIGIPNFKKHEPTWLAPSEIINVPCGGSAEATILPRKLR